MPVAQGQDCHAVAEGNRHLAIVPPLILYPWMLHEVIDWRSRALIFLHAFDEEVLGLAADILPLFMTVYLRGNVSTVNICDQVLQSVAVERVSSLKKHIEHYAKAPNVNFEVKFLEV